MEKQFYQWYRRIHMEMNNELYESRWKGILAVNEKYRKLSDDINIVKLYTQKACSKDFIEGFAECFSELDHSFDQDNKMEISFLAGCALIYSIESDDDSLLIIMLLKVIKSYYEVDILPEVFQIAEEKFSKMSLSIRDNKNDLTIKGFKNMEVENFDKSIPANTALSVTSTPLLIKTLQAMEENIHLMIKWNSALSYELTKYREESQILSWLMGGWSNILNIPINTTNAKEVVLPVGCELASFINNYPGPYAAEAFIQKMLEKCKNKKENISLTDVIQSTSKLARKHISQEFGEVLDESITPIITAIKVSLDSDEPELWKLMFNKATNLNSDDIKISVLEWAIRMYYECLTVSFRFN